MPIFANRRGVELSMNVIIIAAIALIILVVLVLLLTGAFSRVKNGTGCRSQPSGQCVEVPDGSSCSTEVGETGYIPLASDCPEGQTCCIRPLGGG
jgi:hypothetical protein